jgi:HEAT repeat protein
MKEEIIAVKLAQLRSASAEERASAAQFFAGLGDSGDAASAAVPLVEACNDPDEQVRQWADGALENLGPPRTDDVAALVAILDREEPNTAYWSATLLGRLGSRAASARPALVKAAARDQHPNVAKRAAWALKKLDERDT